LVKLVLGASLRAGAGALAPALGGRLVLERGAAGLLGLPLLGAGLVHRAGGDLLRLVLRTALVEPALLDVLVLAFALLAPCVGHGHSSGIGRWRGEPGTVPGLALGACG